MVAIAPYASASAKRSIDGPCDADGETLNAASETRRSLRLDEEMHVIHLDAEMENAKRVVGCARHRVTNGAEWSRAAQRRDVGAGAQCHVHGTARVVQRPRPMHDGSPSRRRLPAGPGTTIAPGANQFELVHHLIRALLS